ncbi:DPP IV N-terminal domain-containing protein [Solitalea sp. MAHUQ-68]|uniref:DPP IV N-terminal domain-containing protein n=1 Tax=Solitalea agri TaxID=2953739 RepID=A0A9X2F006_9SPHI|nr:DPP IV N-terminal domain-containing protein [Solitalea agri]MCO4291615.1 DPP IV N-terminal domain-containing protein [Solitalea agri]
MHRLYKQRLLTLVVSVIILAQGFSVQAQYFGRNKVQYEKYKFKVLKTPHFDIYNYMGNDTVIKKFADMSERWYARHRNVLDHRFDNKNPIMIYNNHSDFSQTTLSSENIGQGTGGVTEGYRGRVFMPFFEAVGQTDHVLGHELVHAFQYDILKSADSLSLYNIQNLPLWMVEGMAEYLSLGRKDSHTAMWMRDAVLSKDFPSLRDLTVTNKYFPYRYGQAFWAFVAGVWGDTVVKPLFVNTAKFGYQMAVDSTLGYEEKVLSNMWKTRTIENYKPFIKDTIAVVGKKLVRQEDLGEMNISPVLSPDGNFVTFFSEKNLFSIDLFLADVRTGRVIRKLSSQAEKLHVDDYNYIQDAGTWSPDGTKYAYIVMIKGKSVLVIVDVSNGRTLEEIKIHGLPYFSNPSWSPDGKQMLLTAMIEGKSDLFIYNLQTKKTKQLTNDFHSEFHGSWSNDGQTIVFSSDRGSDTNLSQLKFGAYKICLLDIATGKIEMLDFFPGANNFNAQFSHDDKKIYFLSNADGLRNLYEYNLETKEMNKLTKYFTGISGITEDAPAFSVRGKNDLIAYCLFRHGDYNLYKADASEFPRFKVDPTVTDFTLSLLPPFDIPKESVLTKNLENISVPYKETDYLKVPYRPKFSLVTVSQTGVGVGYNSQYGTGVAGGIGFLFGDILDRNQLYAVAQVNGEIYDIGGGVTYINRAGRVNWGVGISHTPYFSSYYGNMTYNQELDLVENPFYRQRTFVEELALYSYYPISQTLRWELNTTLNHYSYRIDKYSDYYTAEQDAQGNIYPGVYLGQDRSKVDAKSLGFTPFNLATVQGAYVGDNSQFGLTAPVKGQRFRMQIAQTVGNYNFTSLTGDYRRYFYTKPWTFAFRGMYYGRYGNTKDLRALYPIYLGYDQLIHGYNSNSLYDNFSPDGKTGVDPNDLLGDHMAVANFEVRFPLTGPEKLSKIKSGFLFSDLAFFMDGGLAWTKGQDVNFSWQHTPGQASPIYSAGVTLRVNLFGYAVIEPYYAIPFQRYNPKPYFGLFISGGGW